MLIFALTGLAAGFFLLGRARGDGAGVLAFHAGLYAGLGFLLPALALAGLALMLQSAGAVEGGVWRVLLVLAAGLAGGWAALKGVRPRAPLLARLEKCALAAMFLSALAAILITAGIIFSLLFETLRFFTYVSPLEFFFSGSWSPQTALREGQIAASGQFGAAPLFAGTLLITCIALFVAGPIGLLAAIFTAEYASLRARSALKPAIEVLAGVPTVVYGFFAALTVAPFIRANAEALGLTAASESALAAGLVMGIMIIPFISSLADDVISAVPDSLREGAYALGATRAETITRIILPAALPGIAGAFLLAISRAVGETMIVVMAAGLAANLTANPLESVTTVTVQIVTLLVGDQEFDSAKTLAAFALGMSLFLVTLGFNALSFWLVRRYRQAYD